MPKQEIVYQRNEVCLKKFLAFLSIFVLCAFLPAFVVAQEVVTDLVKKVSKAVVIVYTYDSQGNATGQGTGFFVSADGAIITNYHVLKGVASTKVKTASGKSFSVKRIIAEDKENDLVKIAINAKEITFPTVPLAKEDVEVGQRVVVIGGPLGLEGTVSDGIVSAVRDIPTFGKIIQMTAPISHGSSGSPVFNMKGEVVGIATLMLKEGQNLNFAIPASKIKTIKPRKEISFSEWTMGNLEAWLKSAEGLYQKGLAEFLYKNYVTALSYFQESVKQNSKNADAHFYIGFCYGEFGRHQEAIEAYKQAIRIKPDYAAHSHHNMGIAYCHLGRYHEAIEAYKQAIRIKPNYADAHYNMGVAYRHLGRHREVIEACKQTIRIKPDYADAHYNMGIAYHHLGRYYEAVEAYKQAIRIKPNYADAHYNMGVAYRHLGRYYEAVEAYKQAIRIKPDDAGTHYVMGLTYLLLGDRGGALDEYKILKDLDRDLANKLFNLIYK